MSRKSSSDYSGTKKAFIIWLQSQNNIKFNPDQIVRIFDEVSAFAIEHSISKKSIWEMSSRVEFSNFSNRISSMRLFRNSLRKESKLFSKISRYYKVFLDTSYEAHFEEDPTSSDSSSDVVLTNDTYGNQDIPSSSFSKIDDTPNEPGTSISQELAILLKGEEYAPLRGALKKQNITTIDDFKALKLWPFMNRYNLYSIGKRQAVFSKINALLYPSTVLDKSQAFTLHVGEDEYSGKTPSESLLQFCNHIFNRHPLQFKLLIGTKMRGSQEIPIRMQNNGPDLIEIPGLHAYISSGLSIQEVISITEWIQNKCGEKSVLVAISEPDVSTKLIDTLDNESEITAVDESDSDATPYKSDDDTAFQVNDIGTQIEQFVLKADMTGVSYDDVKNTFHITMVGTKRYIASAIHIIDVKGKLYHDEALIDFEEGADKIEEIIEKLLQKNNGYASSTQLYEYARTDMNMFLTDNDMNDERSVYDIARHLFEKVGYHNKHFSFYGNTHISRVDHPVTCNLDIIKIYAADKGGVFSFDDLTHYLDSIGVGTGNLRVQMRIPFEPIFFYYAEGLLMYSENMHIDDTWKSTLKKAIDDLFNDVGDYIILRSIPKIWLERLPSLPYGCPWTPLLLQSVLRCYSKELGASTIPALAGQSLETLHAMLVKNDSLIQGFGDVVVAFLIDANVKQRSFEAEELRRILVDSGIIHGNELIWNMHKALGNDERFAWDASGSHVIVEV